MEEFIAANGLATSVELIESHTGDFVAEMQRGLRGEPCSLQMLPTYIDVGDGPQWDRPVIVVDAGGTNLRVALVRFAREGEAEILYHQTYPMLGLKQEIDAKAFYAGLAEYIAPVADKADCISVCFSFPARILPNRDAEIIAFSKEIQVKDAAGTVIGACLREALAEKGVPSRHSVVVINDTVASLLGAQADNPGRTVYGSYIGFILGTGFNTCYIERNANIKGKKALSSEGGCIINMESGCYNRMPLSPIDKAFFAGTIDPQDHQLEKLTSGAYQGGLFLAYVKAAAGDKVFSPIFDERVQSMEALSGMEIDRFCDHPYGENPLALLCGGEEDRIDLYRLLNAFYDRVALISATSLTAVLHCLGEKAQNPCRPVCISAEGTTFYKSRLTRPKIDYYMNACAERRMGLCYRFVRVESANITGTAAAGLLGN